jgi:hypothetical protein
MERVLKTAREFSLGIRKSEQCMYMIYILCVINERKKNIVVVSNIFTEKNVARGAIVFEERLTGLLMWPSRKNISSHLTYNLDNIRDNNNARYFDSPGLLEYDDLNADTAGLLKLTEMLLCEDWLLCSRYYMLSVIDKTGKESPLITRLINESNFTNDSDKAYVSNLYGILKKCSFNIADPIEFQQSGLAFSPLAGKLNNTCNPSVTLVLTIKSDFTAYVTAYAN